LKPKSALGRLHIWRIECLAIAQKPLIGHGSGAVLGAYGRVQADFFKKTERSDLTKQIAGCPEYAFNEFLKIGVEHGVIAMIAVLACLILFLYSMFINQSEAAIGAVALAIFSFFSYPFSLWQFKVIALLLCVAVLPQRGICKYLYPIFLIIMLYAAVFVYINESAPRESLFRKKYSQGYLLHLERRYCESNYVLMEGAEISSDPMFHNIIGKNYEAQGKYKDAEYEYLQAHYMVPCRLYPLILMMEMNVRLGYSDEALKWGEKALTLPVNLQNDSMKGLYNRAKVCVDSLKIKGTL